MVESLAEEVHNFIHGSITKSLATIFQGLGKPNGDILHLGVCFLGAANKKHFLGPSNAFVFILVIQADTEQPDNFRLGSRSTNHDNSPIVMRHVPFTTICRRFRPGQLQRARNVGNSESATVPKSLS
jgi:hypothetical protein